MFRLNGILWNICIVNYDDAILYDYINDIQSVAVTDLYTHTVYISNRIHDKFLLKVLRHELYHCYEFSGLVYDLPTYYEEIVADYISTYGEEIIDLSNDIYNLITYYE